MRSTLLICLLAAQVGLCACATTPSGSEGGRDPIQPVNRKTFYVNDKIDLVLWNPLATGWRWISPETVRLHLSQFFDNLRFPVRFVNSLLQADARQSGRELGRLVVNTTVGLAGFFDPATAWKLEKRDEDFGQTLAIWRVPAGAYLVLPVLGPSTPRHTVGRVADAALSPTVFLTFLAALAVTGANQINSRAQNLDLIRELREDSLDYYVAIRNGYFQIRRDLIANGEAPADEPSEDLYEVFDGD